MNRINGRVTWAALIALAAITRSASAQVPVGRSLAFDGGPARWGEVRVSFAPFVRQRTTLGFDAEVWRQANFDRTRVDLDVVGRIYPAPATVADSHRRFAAFAGLVLGLHMRSGQSGNQCITGPCPDPVRTSFGLEPGAEVGLRLLPAGRMFLDVGLRTYLTTTMDPTHDLASDEGAGHVIARPILAAGITW